MNLRVAQNGHYVAPNTIETRYFKSLNYLANALSESDDACLWDNSGSVSRYFCNVTNGANVVIVDDEYVPNWFSKYVINKIKK